MAGRDIKILDRQFFPAGTLVIEQGTMGNRAFVIESGRVEVYVNDANGNPVPVTELGKGSMFGEMAVLTEGKRTANVRTIENTILVIVSARELKDTMSTSAGFFNKLMNTARERMKDTSTKLKKKERKLAAIEKNAPLTLKDVAIEVAEVDEIKVRDDMLTVEKKRIPPGTTVIEQGTVGNNAFLIESGRVQVFRRDENGKETVLAELGAKALIGEIGALSNKPRSASVRTLEETVLIPISASELQVVMSTSGGLHNQLLGMITSRLKDTHRKLFGKDLEVSPDFKMPDSSDIKNSDPEVRGIPVLDKLKGLLEKTKD